MRQTTIFDFLDVLEELSKLDIKQDSTCPKSNEPPLSDEELEDMVAGLPDDDDYDDEVDYLPCVTAAEVNRMTSELLRIHFNYLIKTRQVLSIADVNAFAALRELATIKRLQE